MVNFKTVFCTLFMSVSIVSVAHAQGAGPSGFDSTHAGPAGSVPPAQRSAETIKKSVSDVAAATAVKTVDTAPVRRVRKSEVPPLTGTPDNLSGTNSGINGN